MSDFAKGHGDKMHSEEKVLYETFLLFAFNCSRLIFVPILLHFYELINYFFSNLWGFFIVFLAFFVIVEDEQNWGSANKWVRSTYCKGDQHQSHRLLPRILDVMLSRWLLKSNETATCKQTNKKNLKADLTPFIKVCSKWLTDLNINHRIIKFLEYNIGEKSRWPCISNDFLDIRQKVWPMNKNNW